MWISIRAVSMAFRAVATLIVALGVVLTCVRGVPAAELAYFTVQSGSLLAICLGWCLWATYAGQCGPPTWLKGAATLYACITGLVSNVVLTTDLWASLGSARLSTRLLHVITPLLAVADWLVFDEHGRCRWAHALLWLSYPIGYLGFALVCGHFIRWYPYPFLDVTTLGYRDVLLNAMGCAITFYALALLLVAADRRLGRRRRDRAAVPVALPDSVGPDVGMASKP